MSSLASAQTKGRKEEAFSPIRPTTHPRALLWLGVRPAIKSPTIPLSLWTCEALWGFMIQTALFVIMVLEWRLLWCCVVGGTVGLASVSWIDSLLHPSCIRFTVFTALKMASSLFFTLWYRDDWIDFTYRDRQLQSWMDVVCAGFYSSPALMHLTKPGLNWQSLDDDIFESSVPVSAGLEQNYPNWVSNHQRVKWCSHSTYTVLLHDGFNHS